MSFKPIRVILCSVFMRGFKKNKISHVFITVLHTRTLYNILMTRLNVII